MEKVSVLSLFTAQREQLDKNWKIYAFFPLLILTYLLDLQN